MNSKKYLSWDEVKASSHEKVIVLSYGYTERGILSEHFEPFKNKREIEMGIDKRWNDLDHKWLMLDESITDVTFFEENGNLYADDPDLWARP